MNISKDITHIENIVTWGHLYDAEGVLLTKEFYDKRLGVEEFFFSVVGNFPSNFLENLDGILNGLYWFFESESYNEGMISKTTVSIPGEIKGFIELHYFDEPDPAPLQVRYKNEKRS